MRNLSASRTVRDVSTPRRERRLRSQPKARREARLRALFEEHSTPVFAYALRHIGSSAAQDIVSEVFMVAWRRIDDVPVSDPLPWLLVVARNTIRNKLRGTARQRRVADELGNLQRSSTATAGADETAIERRAMLTALTDLSAVEREAVLLTGWDGLSVHEAAPRRHRHDYRS